MKNTKKIVGLLLVMVLMLSVMLTACGGNETPTTTVAPQPSTTTQPGDKLEISVNPASVEFFAGEEFEILMGVTANRQTPRSAFLTTAASMLKLPAPTPSPTKLPWAMRRLPLPVP